jgi:general secretion pathway protein E
MQQSDTIDTVETDIAKRLGALLLGSGKLDQVGLARAERAAESGQGRLDHLLVRLGLVGERDLAAALSSLLGCPLAQKADYPIAPLPLEHVSVRFLREMRAIPLGEAPDGIAVAFGDPLDGYAAAALELATGRPVIRWVGVPAEIEAALAEIYGPSATAAAESGDIETVAGDGDDDLELLRDLAREAPVIRIVNLLIARAVEERASDIHLESFRGHLAVRYRIDGDLADIEPPPARTRAAIISRIKIMAGLDIAERRLPQDGRIRMAVRGQSIDLRVSTLPMMHGESVVLRILDRSGLELDLNALGFDPRSLQRYRAALQIPNGVVLITGPTGSGKTSTLYASMLEIASSKRKIVTVEDPVEYELPGINQIQTHSAIGLTFAATLRSILRHDPDIIMIGEIRDQETAEIAVQAALTGHLVLSTLHTNSAAAAINRLLDMGVANYLLTSTVEAVVAQRLVRRLCGECREAYEPAAELARELAIERPLALAGGRLWRARGCPSCGGRGYRGRVAVTEVLQMTDALRRLVLRDTSTGELHRAAVEGGMASLYENGLAKAFEGVTSIDEVLRVSREA